MKYRRKYNQKDKQHVRNHQLNLCQILQLCSRPESRVTICKKIIIVVDIVNRVILRLGKCDGDLGRRYGPLVEFVELERT